MKSKLMAVYHVNGSTERYDVKNYFVASDRPFFLGLIIEPSAGLWAYLKNSSDIVMEFSGKSANFRVPYKIEVGRNTIFFITPVDGSITSGDLI
ncbi:MAG: hypothetical protein M1306_03225 [Candidatus Thermoplasmatota archaeon]|jgi:hypothetical protein|nr:hypothetical protein [Candidatus Thermoplasmatota archaeon]